MHGRQDVRRVPAGADCDQDVTRNGKGMDLTGKNLFVTVVVAQRSQSGRIGRESNGRPASTLALILAHQLSRNVLRIRRASAVSAQQDLLAVPERATNEVGALLDLRKTLPQNAIDDVQVFLKSFGSQLADL
jgi:hypothetical protein